jgi:hypothetical protein
MLGSSSSDDSWDSGFMPDREFVIGLRRGDGRHSHTRMPDGFGLSAAGWAGVWAACPELGVPIRSVRFECDAARAQVIEGWGSHPDMPA